MLGLSQSRRLHQNAKKRSRGCASTNNRVPGVCPTGCGLGILEKAGLRHVLLPNVHKAMFRHSVP